MVELGRVAMYLVLAAAVAAVARPRSAWGQRALVSALAAGSTAIAGLAAALARGDWSVAYVVDHSRAGIATPLRMAGLWAGPEGSFLLWSTLVAGAAVVAHRLAPVASRPAVARLGGVVVAAHASVQVVALDPFRRLAVPAVTGLGLQPVLEHPAMIWHPPLLYAGLVGLLVPALLLAGPAPAPWPAVRSSLAVALGLLTAGLATGGRWAYAELGWGGYWGWDPIENVALVAWAAGLAALHWPVRLRPRSAAALSAAPAVVVVWSGVLTRTGAVTSVHAFSDEPGRAAWLVGLAAVTTVVVVAAGLDAVRGAAPVADGGAAAVGDAVAGATQDAARGGASAAGSDGAGAGRASGRTWAAAVLGAMALVVALGVLAPVVQRTSTGDEVVVAGHFFTRALLPVSVVGAVALVASGRRRWVPIWAGAVAAVLLVGTVGAATGGLALGAAGGAVAGDAVAALARRPGRWRAGLGHLGMAVLLVGVAGTTGREDAMVTVPAQHTAEAAGVSLRHLDLAVQDRPSGEVARATVEVDGRVVHPAIASQRLRRVSTTEFAHVLRPWEEVQVGLVDGDAAAATYRVIRHPLLPLVWAGAALVAAATSCGARRSVRSDGQRRRRLRSSSRPTVSAGTSSEAPEG